jgi:hypothetical protein
VEDGIRKWRHDEVRADMQDEYSEGVVDKKVEDAEYQKRLNAAILKLMESDVWTDEIKLAAFTQVFADIQSSQQIHRKEYGLQHIQDSRRPV